MSKSSTFGAPSTKRSIGDPTSRTSVETVEQISKKSSIANPSKEGSQQLLQSQSQKQQPQQQQQASNEPAPFNHGASKYKWCCGIHVNAGPIVAALITWYFIWSPILNCYNLISDRPWLASFLLAYWVLWLPLIICNLIAVGRNNRHLLVPFIAYGLLSFIVALILFIVKIVLKEYGSDEVKTEIKIIQTVISDIYVQFFWYLFNTWITLDCYLYFRDRDNYRGNTYIGYVP